MASARKGPTAHTENRKYDDDDHDAWIPLSPRPATSASIGTTATSTERSNTSSVGNHNNPPSSFTESSIVSIQKRLESNIRLKANLVDHPIDHFWKRFLVNFAGELWRLDLRIRLGLSLVLIGSTLKIFLLSTWYLWYPRLALFIMIGVVPFIYLDPLRVRTQLKSFMEALYSSPSRLLEGKEPLNPTQLRIFCLVLIMCPTALEIHTISFLTNVHVAGGWLKFTTLVSGIILMVTIYLLKTRHWKPRESIHKGLLILYSSALLLTLLKADLRRTLKIASPLSSATGALLITYNDDDMEWLTQALRSALRLSLRDVLSSISERVGEDEMLQLAIIRWIVDYWSTCAPTHPNTASFQNEAEATSTSTSESSSESFGLRQTTNDRTSTGSVIPSSSNESHANESHVNWDELRPMLDIATDQMNIEVHSLQSPRKHQDVLPNSSASHNSASEESSATNNGSIDSLRSMLMSLDVDDRGPSAVKAYRAAVESFPPTQSLSIFISVVRRCPALLTLLLHLTIGVPGPATTIAVLLPFIVLELLRIQEWMRTCLANVDRDTVKEDNSECNHNLSNIDSMTILLSGDKDSPSRPPTLMLVWRNILGSVSALEVGLSATRCIKTTSVAVDFAGNIMSLVQLGYEVKEYGLIHGLAVMGKELFLLNTTESSSQKDTSQNFKYAGAAMDAVRNGQIVARNLKILLEDENVNPLLGPVVGVLCALSGHGWLWGREECSSVEKVSINDGEDQLPDFPTDLNQGALLDHADPDKPEACDANHQLGGDELSPVIDLVWKAHEQGCISTVSGILCGHHHYFEESSHCNSLQAEKNEFCEKLADLSSEELKNSAVIDGMKRSLELVIVTANPGSLNTESCSVAYDENTPILELVEIAYAQGAIVKVSQNYRFIMVDNPYLSLFSLLLYSHAG